MSFLSLPTELQVKIYSHILHDVIIEDPKPQHYAAYSGIILSCKKILHDFEHEWAKVWNNFLVDIAAGSVLRPVTVERFTESKNIIYLFPKNDPVSGHATVSQVVEAVCGRFRSFVIDSNDSNAGSGDETLGVTERDFFITVMALWKDVKAVR
jgi:hypothetical protein